ncbi:hypothetical protein D9M68_610990 [compost metagenome]
MAQAVQRPRLTQRSFLETGLFEHPVKEEIENRQRVLAVLQVRHEDVVFRPAETMGLAVRDQAFIDTNGRSQAHDGLAVPLGLRQVHPQVDMLASHHLDVLVLHELDVAGAHEGVDHPADQPRQLVGHDEQLTSNPETFAGRQPIQHRVRMAAQAARRRNQRTVLRHAEAAARLAAHLDLREHGGLAQCTDVHAMHDHLAEQHEVLRDRRARKALFPEVIDQALHVRGREHSHRHIAQQRNDVRTQSVAHDLPCGPSDFAALHARSLGLHQSLRKVTDRN